MKANISAKEALRKLVEGNKRYMESITNPGDISKARRFYTYENGQSPWTMFHIKFKSPYQGYAVT